MLLEVGLGPGLDSMSPARSRRSASHAAGTHGWLPQKTGRPGLRRGGVGGYNLHSVPPNSPPDCGTVAHQPRSSSTSSRISSTLSYFWISERKAIDWVFPLNDPGTESLASATSFSLNVADTARSTSGFPDVNTSP